VAKSAKEKNSSLIYLKKIYLLAAMLFDKYKEARKLNIAAGRKGTDLFVGIENPWRGVEAYHYLMLAQRQLYRGTAIKYFVKMIQMFLIFRFH
jgi:hypothetical protein